jgi:hypothetical protein
VRWKILLACRRASGNEYTVSGCFCSSSFCQLVITTHRTRARLKSGFHSSQPVRFSRLGPSHELLAVLEFNSKNGISRLESTYSRPLKAPVGMGDAYEYREPSR